MVDVVASVIFGALFGLALAAPPGPMNAVIAQETVMRGWTAGFRAGLGAMTADLCFLALALLGVTTVLERLPTVRSIMIGIGGVLMLVFAYGAVREATDDVDWEADGDGKGFLKAFSLALTNPYQILFWLTVGVGLLEPGRVDVLATLPAVGQPLTGILVIETGTSALLIGFFAGIGCWIVGFPASLVAAGRRLDRFATAIAYGSAVVLASFGVLFLADATRSLL